jgi:class 3 adenylate cyclase/ketosteroid isomerase-like protein
VSCATCGRENRAGARFCGGCGTALAVRCPACGSSPSPGARFCEACGAALGAAAPAAARKVLTIVFADLIGSTALHERLDPESVSRVMEAYHAAVRVPIEAHGGTVVQLLGDGVMCAFGVPRAGEDDALRAVHAAVDVQRSFAEFVRERPELAGRVGLRVAVNTGEVVVSDDYAAGIGDPLNVAARLQQEAKDGDVLVGGETQRLVADHVTLEPLGVFALKGRAEPVAAYRVASLERPARAAVAGFVGRERELRRLAAGYDAAVAAPQTKLVVVLGSPGLGKSRLVTEFTRGLAGRASVLVARCHAAGGAALAPLAESLRAALDAAALGDEAERTRIRAGIEAILAGTPAPPEETFFVVRRLLAAHAAEQPVVLEIDDLHWAEPLLLDLVEHLVQWGAGVPLFVLAAARPELRDARSSLAAPGPLVADVLALGGLDAAAATQLAASMVGADALPAAVAGRVLATSEGNPLFLVELVRMLVSDGALRREGERWVTAVELAKLDMPPTIQALLAARIERLRPEERLVLERAAVVGRQFSRAAVAHLLPPDAQAELGARLEALRRSELIEPDTDGGWFLGEPSLRFHHVLIRDAAYRRSLRNTRAELHARFADFLARRAGTDTALHDETIGWHLEQAFQHQRELGPLDAASRDLGTRAARHLADAGRRALARDDLRPAASLLGRALDCLDATDSARAELTLDWCEALLSAGDVAAGARATSELDRFCDGSERIRAWQACFRGQLAVLSDAQALRASAESVAGAAETLAARNDAAGEAKAHSVHALVLAQLGQIGACEAALDRALAAARRAGDRRRANAVLAGAPLAALWGPSPVTRASGRCLDVVRVLRITQGAPAVEAVALRCQAMLETLRGRSEAARRMIASSRRMVEELGITQRVLEADVFAGLIELVEGDGAAAERLLRPAYAGLCAQGLGIDAAQAAALLARAALMQGRAGEAEALSRESEALAGDSFKAAIGWRGVRAEALAARGDSAAAVELARAAVEIAAATDDLLDHADARRSLAVALHAAGQEREAAAEEARALELWRQKGATVLAGRARTEAAEAAGRDRRAEALPGAPREARRVRENAATACFARFREAALARDMDAIVSLCAEMVEVIHHPTGAVIDREGGLQRWRLLLRSEGLDLSVEHLATLGERLSLGHDVTSFTRLAQEDLSFGASSSRYLSLFETNERGNAARVEVFAEDRLDDAIARLYARYAELQPPGSARERASLAARGVSALLNPWELEAVGAVLAPDVVFCDRRKLGLGSWRGAENVLAGLRVRNELTSERASRSDEVLASNEDVLLTRRTISGVDRASGGAYEMVWLSLLAFGRDGRLTHCEHFDVECEAEALTRLDELAAPPFAEPTRFPNAATRAMERAGRLWESRDWDATMAMGGAGFEMEDRRSLVGFTVSGEEFLANQRFMFAMRPSGFRFEPLATRGERLAVSRTCFFGRTRAGGDIEVPMLNVVEVDGEGRYSRLVIFEPDALDDVFEELEARYAAGEGAPHAALLRHVREFRPPQLPDDLRLTHLRVSSTALIGETTWHGTREGNDFETALVFVSTHDGSKMGGWELFDPQQTGDALARYEALSRPRALWIANAAARSMDRIQAAWDARDWQGVEDAYAPDCRMSDRRKLIQLETDRKTMLGSLRDVFLAEEARLTDGSARAGHVLATRGERLALAKTGFALRDRDVGPSELTMLTLIEVDEAGRRVALATFDAEDVDAALAELDARYAAGEARTDPHVAATMETFRRSFEARDWDALGALFAADVAVHDERRLGWEPLRSRAAYVASLRSLVELAPDTRLRLDHVRLSARGVLWVAAWSGTREGGPFETPWVIVSEHDAEGLVRRFEQYDVDDLDAALARFAALRPDAHAVPPNEAARTEAERSARFLACDWDALRALAAEEFVFEDRRRRALVAGGVDLWLQNLEVVASWPGRHASLQLVATLGERIALGHLAYSAEAGRVEGEFLRLIEIDADGRLRAWMHFDLEDRAVAFAEAQARFAAGEAAAVPAQAAVAAQADAFTRHDWAALRACFTVDATTEDHRRLGLGAFPVDGWIDSLRAFAELAPDVSLEPLRILAWSERGRVSVLRVRGTREGGSFENVFVGVAVFRDGRIHRYEFFDLADAELALTRFAEPAGAPQNAATQTARRMFDALARQDWAEVEGMLADGLVFEDRRPNVLLTGGRALLLQNLRYLSSPAVRAAATPLAVFGDYVAIHRFEFRANDRAAPFEVETLQVAEVDAAGRLVATIVFGPRDRAGAWAEAQRRAEANA